VLGYHKLTPVAEAELSDFFTYATVIPVDRVVVDTAILLRRQRRMSLGDAVIAATALVHGLTLVTRNTVDFLWITGLTILDPFQNP
jgi:toxin FitB